MAPMFNIKNYTMALNLKELTNYIMG